MKIPLKSCSIRSWTLEDAVSAAAHANNRNVWINLRDYFPHPYTLEDSHSYLSRVTQTQPETSFAIDISGQAVGGIGVKLESDVHRFTAELGYWLGEDFWGRGIMTEAVTAFSDYLFQAFPLHRVFAVPYSSNSASGRILEKAGFVYEGLMRKSVVKDGRILDQLIYAKVKD